MDFNVYEQNLNFKEFENVLKSDLFQIKERFLEEILSANEEKEKLTYSLEEMAAEIKAYEDLLISVYEYVRRREEAKYGDKKK